MSDELRYQNYLKQKEEDWELLCIRCGGCCGAYDDPCLHLKRDSRNKFYCEIYNERLGIRKTIGGEQFNCVLVKEILHTHWRNDHFCVYKRYLKYPWELLQKQLR